MKICTSLNDDQNAVLISHSGYWFFFVFPYVFLGVDE